MAGAGRKKPTKREEQNFHVALMRSLGLILTRDTKVVHVPNGGWRTAFEGKILKAMGVMAGFPDLLFLHIGKAFLIELKLDGTGLSDDQIDAHEALALAGVPIAVCRSLEDVLAQLRLWNIPTRLIEGASA